jgi:hypothetical protein
MTALCRKAFASIPVHVPQLPTDKGFVNLATAALNSTEFGSHCSGLEGKSQTVKHEPSGFLRHAKIAVNFIRRNPILAANEHPEGREPLLQWDGRILEDSLDLDGELATAVPALPPFLSLEVVGIFGVIA